MDFLIQDEMKNKTKVSQRMTNLLNQLHKNQTPNAEIQILKWITAQIVTHPNQDPLREVASNLLRVSSREVSLGPGPVGPS